MPILPIILDLRPEFPGSGSDRGATLLTLPMGVSTMADLIHSTLSMVEADSPCVLAPPGVDDAYALKIKQALGERAIVTEAGRIADVLHKYEPSDWALVIDPRYWPVNGADFDGLLAQTKTDRAAVHAVATASSVDCALESVRCDDQGRVRSIRRYYDGVTHPDVGRIPYSMIPIAALEELSFWSLTELRAELVGNGVLTRDVPLCTGIADLCDPAMLLALAERTLHELDANIETAGYAERSPGVFVGKDVHVHTTATLIGPVVLQHGASVGEWAVVIGPTIVGRDAAVGRDSFVAQSIVGSGVAIADGAVLRHEVRACDAPPNESRDETAALAARRIRGLVENNQPGAFMSECAPSGSARSSGGERIKRFLDVLAAGTALLVFSPVMLVIALLVRVDSRGRVFYGQEREGRGGRVFRCWKFRTMCAGAHQLQKALKEVNGVDGPQFKMDNDPRVTRVGRWLRATNLDELPQLFNVLVGEMSLVGPRPSPFRENQICVPWRRARLSVRPGITGLWQVCRHNRSEGDFHQWIAYDTLYVRHRSLALDLGILAATLLTLGGKWSVPLGWLLRGPEHARYGGGSGRRMSMAA